MKTNQILLSAYIFLHTISSMVVHAAGFTAGDTFTSIPIDGEIIVSCTEGSQRDTVYYHCWDNILNPAEYSYFKGTIVSAARELRLLARHEDGSQREKTRDYDGSRGISKSINLWIASLTQRPLLESGLNKITYDLLDKSHNSIESGEFTVTVNRGTPRRCFTRSYWSNSMIDCRSPAGLCSRYFRDENYCR